MVTTVCSVSFVLHCIFIIIVITLTEPNIYFSFFGLIITELIPGAFITVLYSNFIKLKNTKSGSTTEASSTNPNAKIELKNVNQ